MKIAAISGSLRNDSFNTALLRAAQKHILPGVSLEILDIGKLPLYNEDLILDKYPKEIRIFREAIETSQGILIACPEYNYSLPGVLKNALDWVGTDTLGNLLAGKPVAIMGASRTVYGTTRAQLHLRQVLQAANADVVRKPEVYFRSAHKLILPDSSIQDERSIGKIISLLQTLISKMRKK